jgi:ubiquilin
VAARTHGCGNARCCSAVAQGIDPSITIEDLKEIIADKVSPPCPASLQRLIYKGRILKDAESLTLIGV